MKVLITGSSKLAGALLNHDWPFNWVIDTARIENILHEEVDVSHYDVFLNCAHVGFKQCWLLDHFHNKWAHDCEKYIINFSSRAAKPNISRGLLYSAQKAALNHMADNLTYNSDKAYRMTTLNLGLLEFDEYSTSYRKVCHLVEALMYKHWSGNTDVMTEVTYQDTTNYQRVQKLKAEEYKNGRRPERRPNGASSW